MKPIFFNVVFILCIKLLPAQTDTVFYSVVGTGIIKGEQKIFNAGNNEYHYTYNFNDRGRGNNIKAILQINTSGEIISLHATGVDYFKNPYTEIFSITGDSAQWIINGKRQNKKFNHQMYYTSVIPGISTLQLKWLLKQPGRKGNIFPEGFLRADQPVIKSISLNGKSLNLKLCAVYFDTLPQPNFTWFTEDMQFFSLLDRSRWTAIIQKGYETWVDTLASLQEEAAMTFYRKQINEFSTDVADHLLITHANVFHSATATVQNDMTVEIKKGKIIAVYPSSTNTNLKTVAVIDVKGKFLMPGLWDMHSHYFKERGIRYLAGGVTHIRDMGNDRQMLTVKKQIQSNQLLGPDISFLSGFIDQQGPYQGPTGKIISSLDEALMAVNEYHQLGYNQIKIYSSIQPDWVTPIAAEAKKLGMRVCGHVPAFMTAQQVIERGYNEITHMNFLFLNFMGDTIDTRTPARVRAVGDRAGNFNFQAKEVQSFIALMKEKNIALDPTLNLFFDFLTVFKGDTVGSIKPIINWLPANRRNDIATKIPFGGDDKKEKYISAFNSMIKMLKLLYDNGIWIVAGTDGGDAIALHHELEIYVKAGIPANEVLKIATYNAAVNCGLQDIYGEIRPGSSADLILIDGDPVKNISNIRRVKWVIKNSKMYIPKQLLASQGMGYYY